MWNLGLLGAAGGEALVTSFDLLETTILPSQQSTVTLSNLVSSYGADYQHLQVRMTIGRPGNDDRAGASIQINGSTATYFHQLNMLGSAVTQGGGSGGIFSYGGRDSLQRFTGMIVDINDAFETTKNTTATWFNGVSGTNEPFVTIGSVHLNSTAAVNSFGITAAAGFSANSRISLYGIKLGV
jgi:hypothetical protein